MGVSLRELIIRHEIELKDLSGKTIAIDAFNALHQFLALIRTRMGELLTNRKGEVTSHLIGLFTRCATLLRYNIKPIFVFDGEPPKIKKEVIEKREIIKVEAEKELQKAIELGEFEKAKELAARTTRITKEIIASSKTLLTALGIPIVQAPSEAEAQCAFLVKSGIAHGVASQDYDSLLHGAFKLIQNLSVSFRKKHRIVKPELIDLIENLNYLGIDQDQLIVLAILIGTDYNPGGIYGIGPKTALNLVKKYEKNFDALFKHVDWEKHFALDWKEIFDTIKYMPVAKISDLEFGKINRNEAIRFLVEENDFNRERVESTIKPIIEAQSQMRLNAT